VDGETASKTVGLLLDVTRVLPIHPNDGIVGQAPDRPTGWTVVEGVSMVDPSDSSDFVAS